MPQQTKNMKKITFIAIISLLFNFISSLKAQDLIVKTDGTIIKAKIIEVGEDLVKYKKADNVEGPMYSISKSSLSAINFENGSVEKFENKPKSNKNEDGEEEEEPAKTNPILNDESLKRTIEAIAKDVGEQLLRNCANGKIDNSSTSIYWDGVFKDALTNEINIPIITSWKPKWSDSDGKWIKGKVVVSTDGRKRWVYQNDNGLIFSSCAKQFQIK